MNVWVNRWIRWIHPSMDEIMNEARCARADDNLLPPHDKTNKLPNDWTSNCCCMSARMYQCVKALYINLMFTLQRTAAEHMLLVKERDVLISPSGVFTQTQYICHTANVRRSTLTSCYLLLVFMSTPPAQRTSKHQHSSSKSNTWGCVSSGESQPVTTNCGDVMSLRFWRFLLYI